MTSHEVNPQLIATRTNAKNPGYHQPHKTREPFSPEASAVTKSLKFIAVSIISIFKAARFILDFAISIAVFTLIALVLAWVFDYLPNDMVAPIIVSVGDKSLALLRMLGLPI